MGVDEAADRLRQLLADAGFDPNGPDPAAAWAAFKRFAEYIDHIRAIPDVHWVTASDLPALYPDAVRTDGATAEDLDEVARRIADNAAAGLDYQRIGSRVYSVADQFELLTVAVNEVIEGRLAENDQEAARAVLHDWWERRTAGF